MCSDVLPIAEIYPRHGYGVVLPGLIVTSKESGAKDWLRDFCPLCAPRPPSRTLPPRRTGHPKDLGIRRTEAISIHRFVHSQYTFLL